MSNKQVKFNQNVKYNNDLYVAGKSAEVSNEDYDNLLTAGVIDEVNGAGVSNTQQDEPTDLYTLSREELKKVSKANIITFLKFEEIDYDEKAKKEDLVELIAGE